MRQFVLALGAVALTVSPLFAAPCHDAKGKATKCPTAVAKPMTSKRCKDARGKFAKCVTPAAKLA